MPKTALASWVHGRGQRGEGIARHAWVVHLEPGSRLLSFSNLVEAFVLAAIRLVVGRGRPARAGQKHQRRHEGRTQTTPPPPSVAPKPQPY